MGKVLGARVGRNVGNTLGDSVVVGRNDSVGETESAIVGTLVGDPATLVVGASVGAFGKTGINVGGRLGIKVG